jgi:uncharacterized protein
MRCALYLHGFASSPLSIKALFFSDLLRKSGLEVRIPDLSEGDFEHLSLSRQLSLLERLAAAAPVSLIGSSMGGYLAALYASRHPEVERVVLLAPAFRFAHRWEERLGPTEMEIWRRTDRLEVFHYGDRQVRRLRYGLFEDALQYEDFPDFSQPALIFHGLHDDVVPPAYSETFAATHPNAVLELLPSGHDLLDVLDRIAPQIERFLLPTQAPGM